MAYVQKLTAAEQAVVDANTPEATQRRIEEILRQRPIRTGKRSSKIYVGERGGRYYKRRRADGTTYREYTW